MVAAKRWFTAWLLLSAALCVLAHWNATRSFSAELSSQLQRDLPLKLNHALRHRFGEGELLDLVRSRLDGDLAAIPGGGSLPLLRRCRGRVQQLLQLQREENLRGTGGIVLDWQLGGSPQRTQIALRCEVNWLPLIASQSLLALGAVLLAMLLPGPVSKQRRAWTRTLCASGLPARRALALSARLEPMGEVQRAVFEQLLPQHRLRPEQLLARLESPEVATLTREQLPWLRKAQQLGGGDLDLVLQAALAPDGIHFDAARCRVVIHGIPVLLPRTPFFYYLWYAGLRQRGCGWHLNPATNRSDCEGAAALIALMDSHGGHGKAVNDLRRHGLRARILDQNRNKIKDELIAALGEDLAAGYLFDTERDMKTGRYRYRIATAPTRISVA